jgi:DNA-directed RNA polymerase sigma subunit (sigma70/sigma32)
MPKIDPVKLAAKIEARQAKGISRDPGTVLSWKIPKSSAEEIAAQEAERRARGEKYARELAEAETLELSVEQIAHRFHEEGKAITKEQLKRLERASREPRISVEADVSLNQIGEVAEATTEEPEGEAQEEEDSAAAHKAVEDIFSTALRPIEQNVLSLRYGGYGDPPYSYPEIARLLKLSGPGQAKKMEDRAKRKIRNRVLGKSRT